MEVLCCAGWLALVMLAFYVLAIATAEDAPADGSDWRGVE